MKLANIIVNSLGNDEYNFADQVYRAKEPFSEIDRIEKFRDLNFDELNQETIDEILHLQREIGDDDYSVGELKKEFETAQFAADNFLEGEWLNEFYAKNLESEV